MKRMKQKKEIGAIGIGTLIVFVALILVAAIAAAVIIGTAEDLEERATEATYDARRSLQQVPDIIRGEGVVAASGNIDNVIIYLQYTGNDGIDMSKIVIHVITEPTGGTSDFADLTMNFGNLLTADSTFFGTQMVADSLGHWDPTASPPKYIMGEGTQLRLTLNVGSAATSLPPDSDVRVEITTSDSSIKTVNEWQTPAAYPNSGIIALEG